MRIIFFINICWLVGRIYFSIWILATRITYLIFGISYSIDRIAFPIFFHLNTFMKQSQSDTNIQFWHKDPIETWITILIFCKASSQCLSQNNHRVEDLTSALVQSQFYLARYLGIHHPSPLLELLLLFNFEIREVYLVQAFFKNPMFKFRSDLLHKTTKYI